MLAQKISVEDIDDAEGFVNATINRARLILTQDEREELVATGLEILYRLARDYKPQLDGYQQAGRFSGYASQFLPRKLGDAWHRSHPSHTLRTEADGKRRWHYGERAISLEALTADDPDRHPLMATTTTTDVEARLRSALKARADRRVDMSVQVGLALADGASITDAAKILGLTSIQVREHVAELQAVAHHFEERAAA